MIPNKKPANLFDVLGTDGSPRPTTSVSPPSAGGVVGVAVVLVLVLGFGLFWWFTRGDSTPPPSLNGTTAVRTPSAQVPISAPSVYAVEVVTKSWLNDADLKDIEGDVMNLCLALMARKDFKAADPRVLKDAERRIYRVVVGRAPTRADPELMKLEEKVKKFVWKGRSFDDSARRIETGEK